MPRFSFLAALDWFQSVLSSDCLISSRSTSSMSIPSAGSLKVATGMVTWEALATISSGRFSRSRFSSVPRMMARSITFFSSRMLPGQLYSTKSFSAMLEIPLVGLLNSLVNISMKWWASGRMSSFLSLKAGR